MNRSPTLYKRYRFPPEIIQHLWRAVDQDGEVVDVFLQAHRAGAAAKRFFKRLQKNHHGDPRKIVTDKLKSYGVAHRELMPETIHDTSQYDNNRAELLISRRETGSGVCDDIHPLDKRNAFWVYTRPCTIHSISWSPLGISKALSDATNASLCVLEIRCGVIDGKSSRRCSYT